MIELELRVQGYRLTTAEILYHLPDHPSLLQSFTWQTFDIDPEFPVLTRFLDFWEQSLDGKLHSVRIGHARLFDATDYRFVGHHLVLH
jgi:uncharacterized protein Usg